MATTVTGEALFPKEGVTAQFADQVIDALTTVGLADEIGLTADNVGALIQTFAKGDAFNNPAKFKSDILFHFTFDRSGNTTEIKNENAVDEINAVTGGVDGGFTFALGAELSGEAQEALDAAQAAAERETAKDSGVLDDTPAKVGSQFGLGGGQVSAGILKGGTLTRVKRPGQVDQWLQAYAIPGSNVTVFYRYSPDDTEPKNGIPDEIEKTFGVENIPSVEVIGGKTFDARMSTRPSGQQYEFVGDAAEVIGMAGNFRQMWQQTQQAALTAAGAGDPSITGQLLEDPEYARLVALAALPGSDITALQLQAELRNTKVYRKVYPGIDFFFSRGDKNPEAAWRQYQANVSSDLRSLGVAPDADGSYRSQVGKLLNKGVSDSELRTFTPTLQKIQQNPTLKPLMDQWAQRVLGRSLDFDEFIDVLAGTSDPELNSVIEHATLAHAAERAGVNAAIGDIQRIAASADLSEQQAIAAFTEAEKAVLAVGNQQLQGFGVTTGDFLDVAAGIGPRSGKTSAEVSLLAGKLASERGFSDEERATIFIGFNRRGVPQRQGIGALRGTGG